MNAVNYSNDEARAVDAAVAHFRNLCELGSDFRHLENLRDRMMEANEGSVNSELHRAVEKFVNYYHTRRHLLGNGQASRSLDEFERILERRKEQL